MKTELLPVFLQGIVPAQVGILVPDLAEGIRQWTAILGRSDWRVYTYGPDWVPELTYRGQPGEFSMSLALVGSEPQVELIQPLTGPSIYHEWIDDHGYGQHHLGFWVDSIDEVARQSSAAGIELTQTGRGYGIDGDGGFAYLDTLESLGVILEAIEVPKQRRPSEPIPI
ncbi:MAG: VOC family protein [Candidatus Nanopelagicales bacterium]